MMTDLSEPEYAYLCRHGVNPITCLDCKISGLEDIIDVQREMGIKLEEKLKFIEIKLKERINKLRWALGRTASQNRGLKKKLERYERVLAKIEDGVMYNIYDQ